MDHFKFEAKQLSGSAKTIAPAVERKFAAVSLSYLEGTMTTEEDAFFAVSSAEASFSLLLGRKSFT